MLRRKREFSGSASSSRLTPINPRLRRTRYCTCRSLPVDKQQELDLPSLRIEDAVAAAGSVDSRAAKKKDRAQRGPAAMSHISGVKRPLTHTNSFTGERVPLHGVETPHEEQLGKVSLRPLMSRYFDARRLTMSAITTSRARSRSFFFFPPPRRGQPESRTNTRQKAVRRRSARKYREMRHERSRGAHRKMSFYRERKTITQFTFLHLILTRQGEVEDDYTIRCMLFDAISMKLCGIFAPRSDTLQ